jgi:hypothetical protein
VQLGLQIWTLPKADLRTKGEIWTHSQTQSRLSPKMYGGDLNRLEESYPVNRIVNAWHVSTLSSMLASHNNRPKKSDRGLPSFRSISSVTEINLRALRPVARMNMIFSWTVSAGPPYSDIKKKKKAIQSRFVQKKRGRKRPLLP